MDKPTMVQIYECDRHGHRVATSTVQLSYLLRYAGEHLPAYLVEQFRNDMTVLGRGRIDGSAGRYFEYITIAADNPG